MISKTSTLILYITVIFITFILGCNSQKRKFFTIGIDLTVFNKGSFGLSFLIPWFFFAFAGMSNDYAEYQHIFEVSTVSNFNSLWIEPIYALLNAIIKLIIPDAKIAIIIIKTIIFVLIYKVVYDYREKVPIGLSLLGYMTMAYLDAFCMIRIHLAAAIVLWSIDLYDNYNKKILPIILIVVSIFIHYSTFIFVIASVGYLLCKRKRGISLNFYIGMIVILICSSFIAIPLLHFFTTHVPVLAKYERKYSEINSTGSGLMQYVFHLPFLLIFYEYRNRINNRQVKDNKLLTIGLVLAPFSLFFGIMGYKFEVIGRSYVFFLFIWMMILPRYYAIKREERKKDWLLAGIYVTTWLFFRLLIYIQSGALNSSGIEKYVFMWN